MLTSTKINNKQQERYLFSFVTVSHFAFTASEGLVSCWASKKGMSEEQDLRVEGFTMFKESGNYIRASASHRELSMYSQHSPD